MVEHNVQPRVVRADGRVLPVLRRGVAPPPRRPVRAAAVVRPAGQ